MTKVHSIETEGGEIEPTQDAEGTIHDQETDENTPDGVESPIDNNPDHTDSQGAESEFSTTEAREHAEAVETLVLQLIKESEDQEKSFFEQAKEVIEQANKKLVIIEGSKHLEALRQLGIQTEEQGIFQNEFDLSFHLQFYKDWLKLKKDGESVKREDEAGSKYEKSFTEEDADGDNEVMQGVVEQALVELEGVGQGKIGIFLGNNPDNETKDHMMMHALQSVKGFDTGEIRPDTLDYHKIKALQENQVVSLIKKMADVEAVRNTLQKINRIK